MAQTFVDDYLADHGPDDADITSHDAYTSGVPHATFTRLRESDPVHWTEDANGSGFWSILRYQDCLDVSRDVETFTSTKGIRLEEMTEEETEARRTLMEYDPHEPLQAKRIGQDLLHDDVVEVPHRTAAPGGAEEDGDVGRGQESGQLGEARPGGRPVPLHVYQLGADEQVAVDRASLDQLSQLVLGPVGGAIRLAGEGRPDPPLPGIPGEGETGAHGQGSPETG